MTLAIAIALVHHPVLDRQGETVTIAVTNLDVHDLSRNARTYGCRSCFVVHPIAAQRELVERIRVHWTEGPSGRRIPDRREALSILHIVASLEDAARALGERREAVEVWATAARDLDALRRPLSFEHARTRLERREKPVLLVFGTGWGLARAVVESADVLLEPVRAAESDYNHLSVRAASGIVLDRLLGARS